jgi:predicted MFS family arabinose efflux permease
MREGFHFLWSHPFLRTTALLFGLGNFIGPGLILAIVVIAKRDGVSPPVIGALTAAFGAAIVVGAIASGFVRRRLAPRTTLLLEFWAGVSIFAFVVWPNIYVLVAAVLPTAFVIPSSNAIVHGYRIAMTPDAVLGRSESIRTAISLAIAPIGPLAAGFMLDATSQRATVALFGAVALTLAVCGTLSPALRDIPSLADLGG